MNRNLRPTFLVGDVSGQALCNPLMLLTLKVALVTILHDDARFTSTLRRPIKPLGNPPEVTKVIDCNLYAGSCNIVQLIPCLDRQTSAMISLPAVFPPKRISAPVHLFFGVPVSPDPTLRDEKIRVLVADNSRIHTRLLADALRRDPKLEAIPFDSESTGLVAAALSSKTDVVVMSSNFDEQSSKGFEVLRELRKARHQIHSVLLLASSKDELILKAFCAGARGLFSKNDPLELLSECVRKVHTGKVWASDDAIGLAVDALASGPCVRSSNANGMQLLSKRELQVVRYLAEGLTNREIAEQLKLSQHTIKNYLFRIFDKLGVSSRVELLFMTLSDTSPAPSTAAEPPKESLDPKYSRDESEWIKRSAEAGLPAAQLALAQMYLSQRSTPQHMIEGYMWYLIATERALQARESFTQMMTAEQLEEARRKAAVWLSKQKLHRATPADSLRSLPVN